MSNDFSLVVIALLLVAFLAYYALRFGKQSHVSPEVVALFRNAGASENVARYLACNQIQKAYQAYHTGNAASLSEAKQAIGHIKQVASQPEALLAAGFPASVVTEIERGNTIAAIKAYRTEKNISLREAKATIEFLMDYPSF